MADLSKLKAFVASLGTIKGDLAKVTSLPYSSAPQSVAEIASYWTERPSIFVAPTSEPDPQKRALLVTKWILSSLKAQYYVGRNVKAGIKKPLNAFLGELFFGEWTDEMATSRVLTEQVSHHPPITACYMWNNEYGIRGEGYTRVEMTFDGNVNVKQFGHAMVHLDRFDEDYLIPMPDARIKGFFPAVYIQSSTEQIRFSGRGLFSGIRNTFEAKMYRREDEEKTPLYVLRGQWSGKFTIHDCSTNTIIDTWDSDTAPKASLEIEDTETQDPWESRRAWKPVLEALKIGDMGTTIAEKSKVEEAQRSMRRKETEEGTSWLPVFFSQIKGEDYRLFTDLASAVGWDLRPEKIKGIWKVDREKAEHPVRPFHGQLQPSL